ncbi:MULTISPECIES: universal stress protein [Robiginitalea]|uniref:Stress response protein/ ferredoxin I 3 n=1 Tax=Robiginitalea biformata (strain ATCC BAA-864 / DSM 15991 / KCTC 12146 / HTCC2501) TaxID=313596 RepID=A4CMY6_ROBBH|nr:MULTISPECIES: universal stress protein [Robiginitalea]EAR15028.1 stress response protein/ ferredoxin I 3 [Robiginitalea biformata HTCC2501]MDC6355156.1 universal stress protein [Robiginitalea sp. PM2]MDC6375629.1 universal stress protein [Robiginitalea sp. SP8]
MSLRIAIPTDFSPHAARAARFVLELFREEACTFFLVHTYTPSFLRAEYLIHSPGQIGLGDSYRQRVTDKLEDFREALSPDAGPQHEFYTHAAFNALDSELNEMAGKEKLDLIAMGTQGATGAREVLFGSNAVRVLHRSDCPVLVIPEEAEVRHIRNILFPTDYAVDYDQLNLAVLNHFLGQPKTRLHVLHAFTEADSSEERQRAREQLLGRFGGQMALTETESQGVADAINAFAGEHPVELLVMVRNRHTALENFLVRPVVDRIGLHTRIPFLVLPPEKEGKNQSN